MAEQLRAAYAAAFIPEAALFGRDDPVADHAFQEQVERARAAGWSWADIDRTLNLFCPVGLLCCYSNPEQDFVCGPDGPPGGWIVFQVGRRMACTAVS